jgi:hypothetical protein
MLTLTHERVLFFTGQRFHTVAFFVWVSATTRFPT